MAAVILLWTGTTVLRAQDTVVPPGKSYSAMYERLEVDGGRSSLLMLRWNRWHPGDAEFEGSFGLLMPGGVAGEAGGVYMIGEGPVTVLVRGGATMVAAWGGGARVAAPIGVYGGVALLVGPGHTALRLELSRHEYVMREERFGGWMLGLGLAFIPRPRRPMDRDR